MGYWGEYVPVSVRRAQAMKKIEKLSKEGRNIEPIVIEGRRIAKNFWGIKWCDHLETFADYANRLSRGRTYVRNGSVCHLNIDQGCIEAWVSGSELYRVSVSIKTLTQNKWNEIKKRCIGQVGSILELLQGKVSNHVMKEVIEHKEGLLPDLNEMTFTCSCPDWADMCKHVAAVLYGIGSRLDKRPEMLFRLRGVDPSELISAQLSVVMPTTAAQLEEEDLSTLFGIDIETAEKEPSISILPKTSTPKSTNKKVKLDRTPSKIKKRAWTGKTIQKLRQEKGYSVAELASALHVTPASIYRWEKSEGILKLQSYTQNALSKL